MLSHYAGYSGFQFSHDISANKLIVQTLNTLGKIGSNVFIIITGYFMVNSKFKAKKVIGIIMQTFTYSIIFLLFNLKNANLSQIVKSVMPITFAHYWFITIYIFLYMISPFINKSLENINQKDHKNLILTLVIIQSIIPTFLDADYQYSDIGWFVMLYLIGAYIKKYYNEDKNLRKFNFKTLSITYSFIITSIIILDLIGTRISIFWDKECYFSTGYSIFGLIISIALFLIFENIKLQNKMINKVASTVLGIYIIHENIFMRNIIWLDIVQGAKYINSPYLIINIICGVTSVFVVCVTIEMIRQKLMEPIQNKVIEKNKKYKNWS